MITLMFEKANEKVLVIVEGNNVKFGNTTYGPYLASIDGLLLNHEGVVKEFPDLQGDENWKEKASSRFREKIKSFKTENEISDFMVSEMKEAGFIPLMKQKGGFRIEKINNGQ